MNTALAKKMKKNRRSDGSPVPLLQSALQGLGIGAALAMLLSLALCAFAMSRPDPAALIALSGYSSLFAGALCSGFAAAKLSHRSGIVSPVLAGVLLLGASLIMHMFLGGSDRNLLVQAAMFAAIPLTSTLGGVLSQINLIPRRRKPKFR